MPQKPIDHEAFVAAMMERVPEVAAEIDPDIDGGLLVYVHDGSSTSSDSFGFDIDDGLGNVLAGQSFAFTITAPPTLQFSNVAYSAAESESTAIITVFLNPTSGQTASVDYATSDGTATAGID